MNHEQVYKQHISNILNTKPEQIFLYWKGRVALFTLLKAMGIKVGDEVILPAYTSVVVANAILYMGGVPVYVDIDLETFNTNFEGIKNAITPKTKVIICQNTFGLSSDIEDIVALAKKHKIYTIEDCAQGFGGNHNGKPNGTHCDGSFYSTQWNKSFSTGIGGFLLVNNTSFLNEIVFLNQKLAKPTSKQKFALRILYFVKKQLLVNSLYWPLMKFYRFLNKYKLVAGSYTNDEINSTHQPSNYFMGLSNVQINEGLRNIKKLPEHLEQRKINAEKYTEYLISCNKNHVPFSLFDNHSFLKYPLLVEDKEEVIRKAKSRNIELGEWFNSPIHPIQNNFDFWKMNTKLYPLATFASKHMVNIPVETKHPERIIEFLKTIDNQILDAIK